MCYQFSTNKGCRRILKVTLYPCQLKLLFSRSIKQIQFVFFLFTFYLFQFVVVVFIITRNDHFLFIDSLITFIRPLRYYLRQFCCFCCCCQLHSTTTQGHSVGVYYDGRDRYFIINLALTAAPFQTE